MQLNLCTSVFWLHRPSLLMGHVLDSWLYMSDSFAFCLYSKHNIFSPFVRSPLFYNSSLSLSFFWAELVADTLVCIRCAISCNVISASQRSSTHASRYRLAYGDKYEPIQDQHAHNETLDKHRAKCISNPIQASAKAFPSAQLSPGWKRKSWTKKRRSWNHFRKLKLIGRDLSVHYLSKRSPFFDFMH